MAPHVPLQDVFRLAAQMPAWLAIIDREMPPGEKGDEAVFFVRRGAASLFVLAEYEASAWTTQDGGGVERPGWEALAYLPLRCEHVEAARGREVGR